MCMCFAQWRSLAGKWAGEFFSTSRILSGYLCASVHWAVRCVRGCEYRVGNKKSGWELWVACLYNICARIHTDSEICYPQNNGRQNSASQLHFIQTINFRLVTYRSTCNRASTFNSVPNKCLCKVLSVVYCPWARPARVGGSLYERSEEIS